MKTVLVSTPGYCGAGKGTETEEKRDAVESVPRFNYSLTMFSDLKFFKAFLVSTISRASDTMRL